MSDTSSLSSSECLPLVSRIRKLSSSNIELVQRLNSLRHLRLANLQDTPAVHSLSDTSRIDTTDKELSCVCYALVDDLEDTRDTCASKSEPELTHLHDRLKQLNTHLANEYALCKTYISPQITIRFYFVPKDVSQVKSCFLKAQKDCPIQHIVSSLPPEWNVSMRSTFVASSDHKDLGKFNVEGALLWDLPAWLRYLYLGGPVFVSRPSEDSPSRMKKAGTGRVRKTTRPRHRKRSWEMPGLSRILEAPPKKRKKKLRVKIPSQTFRSV